MILIKGVNLLRVLSHACFFFLNHRISSTNSALSFFLSRSLCSTSKSSCIGFSQTSSFYSLRIFAKKGCLRASSTVILK